MRKKIPLLANAEGAAGNYIKAHILKQLSAAELTDSIMQAELLLRGGALSKDGGAFLQKKAPDAAITAPEKSCAKKSIRPAFMLPSIAPPTAAIRKGGPGFTQKVSIRAPVFCVKVPHKTESFMHFAAAG